MFTVDSVIDQIQSSKKEFVKNLVTNTQVAEALTSYVDVQTEFAKQAVKSATAVSTVVGDELVRAAKEVGKVDYSKFGEGFAKVYLEQQKLWANNPWTMPSTAKSK
ncbi:hypothetical protein UFOVP257_208 [uncultured Caudovirales phage]|uniref:Phasin domain-containing protein n=1 Tax=uncultured Caudovirales phage TaxID=2100421 RepID=A0A6J5LP31_9CAUD|nr:hypothetical protein UFOVP257_208 [uncultured Caudovirales phage]